MSISQTYPLIVGAFCIDRFSGPPVQTTDRALDVCSCAFTVDDDEVICGVESAEGTPDLTSLGHMGFTKSIDGLILSKLTLTGTSPSPEALLTIIGVLQAL